MKVKSKPKKTEIENFDSWMRKKVKSVFYADNEKMCRAYERMNNFITMKKYKISKKVYNEICKDENVKAILEKKSFKKSVKEIVKSDFDMSEKFDLIKELCGK